MTTLVSYLPPVSQAADLQTAINTGDTNTITNILTTINLMATQAITGAAFLDHDTLLLTLKDAPTHIDHMTKWANGQINNYFNITINPAPDGYTILLWPDIQATIARHELQQLHEKEEFTPPDHKYNILFIPYKTTIKTKQPLPTIPNKLNIGVINHNQPPTLNNITTLIKDINHKQLIA